ncbi:importin subunit alpha-4-like [Vigna radiata var. radiata]|uniref:Importin subunit alpha n=1 Tax=Vigna radiata var. radiata TaxID=3916 RepID=A0A1S3TMT4_VIGRR|nr:importin subunit alpha-4-like [Vigna radiata var. radiata]
MSLRPSSSSGSPSKTRRKMYKGGIDAEESRRRREKDLVSIRKIKRQTTLLKKREEPEERTFDTLLDAVPEIVKRICDEYPQRQLEATAYLRTILTIGDPAPPLDDLVKHGILPRFVELLSRDDEPNLQVQVLWVISDFVFTSYQHKSAVVEVGVVPFLVNLVSSSHDDIREEAIWILGNIVGDSPEFRDPILSHGAVMPLLCQLQPHSPLHIIKAATFTLSVLLRGIPPVDFELVKIVLPALQRLLHETDEDVLTDTCWTLNYLSEGPMDNVQAIIELGVCPKLVQLLQFPSDEVIVPALGALGNIAAAGEAHTQAVIDANIIPALVKVVRNAEFEVKKEAVCAIFNVTSKGSDENIRVLAAEGCIEALCELLTCPDPKLVRVCLEGLVNILAFGEANKDEKGNVFAQRVEECGGLDNIETLHLHENNDIHTRALWISDCFRAQNELEDSNMSFSLLDFSLIQHLQE